eukprot:m.135265 g.135265  ORF g.135265 m.135265 type:complete len:371 (+) comp38159_c0_seq7:125-1237(+)
MARRCYLQLPILHFLVALLIFGQRSALATSSQTTVIDETKTLSSSTISISPSFSSSTASSVSLSLSGSSIASSDSISISPTASSSIASSDSISISASASSSIASSNTSILLSSAFSISPGFNTSIFPSSTIAISSSVNTSSLSSIASSIQSSFSPTILPSNTPSIPPNVKNGLVNAVVENSTSFNQSLFSDAVAAAMLDYCNQSGSACASDSRRRKRSLVEIKVTVVNVTETGTNLTNLTVSFYVSESGSVISGKTVVDGLSTSAAQTTLKKSGFAVLSLAVVNPVPTTSAPTSTRTPTDDTGLTTAEIVGIICGSVGGVVFVIMLSVVIYWIMLSKNSAKVNPEAEHGHEMLLTGSSLSGKHESGSTSR